jgi:REP element-mobilizing transposase RayT
MPQSLAKLHLHLVFSTKHREPWLQDDVRDALHAYMSATLANAGCPVTAINSIEDHVHVLFELSRTMTVCDTVEVLKTASSKWIKTQADRNAAFAWQAGYGVFAVSASNVPDVCRYIERQREHHRGADFQDEYRGLLDRQRTAFDERYIWD